MKLFDFLEKFIPNKNKSGKIITTSLKYEIYFKEIALYTAISYIANAISKCEIKVYEANKAVKNELYYIMNISPNNNQNGSQFWHEVIEKMYYKGEALVFSLNRKLYCAESFAVDHNPLNGNKYSSIIINGKEIPNTFKSDEVYLFKLDNEKVKDFINGIYRNYGELIAYATKSYKNTNGSKYKVKIPNIQVGDEEFNKNFEDSIISNLKTFMKEDNSVYTEYEGYELIDITPKRTMKDISDVISLRKDVIELTSQAFNIPHSLMTGNITNVNDVVKSFITFAIDPVTSLIGKELTRKQNNDYNASYVGWKLGNYFKVDTSKINHIDILEVAEKIDKLIASGFMCIDDVRGITDVDKLNTDFGKTHFITKNYDTIENRFKGEDIKNE